MSTEDVKTACTNANCEAIEAAQNKWSDSNEKVANRLTVAMVFALCAIAKAIVCAGIEIAGAIRERKP